MSISPTKMSDLVHRTV